MNSFYMFCLSCSRVLLPLFAVLILALCFIPLLFKKENNQETEEKTTFSQKLSIVFLVAFQVLVFVQFLFLYVKKNVFIIVFFLAFILVEFLYFFLCRFRNVYVEVIVCFLLTVGFCVSSGVSQSAFIKQMICLFAGFVLASLLYIVLLNPKIAAFVKIPAIIISIALLTANVLIGTIKNGSQNWLSLFSVSFQPSELVKIAVVFLAGTSIEIKKYKLGNVIYGAFCLLCIGVLGYLRDFGTAAVYFCVFLTAICLRRVNFKKILFATVGAGAVITVVAILFPYVAKRLFAFGNAWENASSTGYQQTRTMVAVASGGLFGVGVDNGYLRNIVAADTDIVFGVVCEELGIIIGFCSVLCFVLLALYTAKLLKVASPLYSIPAAATSVVFLAQTALNVFGSVDMLPFTGVTLPFISNGGTSMISCVVLIAFIKAAERNSKNLWKKEKMQEDS